MDQGKLCSESFVLKIDLRVRFAPDNPNAVRCDGTVFLLFQGLWYQRRMRTHSTTSTRATPIHPSKKCNHHHRRGPQRPTGPVRTRFRTFWRVCTRQPLGTRTRPPREPCRPDPHPQGPWTIKGRITTTIRCTIRRRRRCTWSTGRWDIPRLPQRPGRTFRPRGRVWYDFIRRSLAKVLFLSLATTHFHYWE